jgi:DNA-binding transcriptional ArsR family regulator
MTEPNVSEEKRNGFFAMGHDTFLTACNLGINEAAALIVLARGSGRDNVTTKWSADAVRDRLGVRWTTAKNAITQLTDAEIVTVERASTRPVYSLARQGPLIWLPNNVVDGRSPGPAPIAALRQTQDPLLLRLFVELYSQQNLREDGGISRSVMWLVYTRQKVAQRGRWTAWHFYNRSLRANLNNPIIRVHRRADLADGSQADGSSEWSDLARRLGTLASLGLIEWVPYLFDGPQGEPIHPLYWRSDVGSESELYAVSTRAAVSIMTPAQIAEFGTQGGVLAAVPSHITEVQLAALGRLTYRPTTRLTTAWRAEAEEVARRYIAQYRRVIEVSQRIEQHGQSHGSGRDQG